MHTHPRHDLDDWVVAAPFAAHLAHLSAATGLPWPVIALWAGVPLRTASRLMGDGRRPLRRLTRTLATRLLAITPEALAALRRDVIPAGGTCTRVAELLALGVGVDALARRLECSPDLVACLAEGDPAYVPAVLAVRVRLAQELADRARLGARVA